MCRVLLRMLPSYHHHVKTYENTLITKFFGLHRIKPSSGSKGNGHSALRFLSVVILDVCFHRISQLDVIYNQQNISGNRYTPESPCLRADSVTSCPVWLDLNYCFYLEPSWRESLLNQIETDSKFLEAQHIMDYSLLLGVHYRAPQHLRSLVSYNTSTRADGLGMVAEEETLEDEINYPQGLVLIPP
ncbi:hypothetical protein M0R45_029584 [Rubus argutus]|uniref:1-phosphatidylinositol-4-phosphate 5-kinase n=1 Tax=Rubus argutus TaxID=59490 RepID=A0AAW1W8H1_RUBAR